MHSLKVIAATAVALAVTAPLPSAPRAAVHEAGDRLPRSSVATQPPAITERFKPVLPCDPSTTVGQEGCEERRVLTADKQLNADARVVFRLLSTDGARRDFVAAQSAWISYRAADCRSQSDAYEGGSEQPVAYASCLVADDSSRRQDLKGLFATLTQGGAKAPAFP
jgi:uncharacterized protein YecT (DUF1311 family)